MPNTSAPIYYSYKPRKKIMLLGITFFSWGAWSSGESALTNDRGLDLNLRFLGPLKFSHSFSPFESTILYWILFIFCVLFVLSCLFALYEAITSKAQIILTDKEITIPYGFLRKKNQIIPFKEVVALEMQKVNHQYFLKITHDKGVSSLNKSLLPKKNIFDEIVDKVRMHCIPNLFQNAQK